MKYAELANPNLLHEIFPKDITLQTATGQAKSFSRSTNKSEMCSSCRGWLNTHVFEVVKGNKQRLTAGDTT